VLDVKCGSGAFMATIEDARALAESLVTVANGAGLHTTALITDMDEPLASCAGNAIEIIDAVEFLTTVKQDKRLKEVVMGLGAELLENARLAAPGDAHDKLEKSLSTGKAAEHFDRMVAELGGPRDFCATAHKHLKGAAITREIFPQRGGVVQSIDTRLLGIAVIEMGGGRRVATDAIDHAVGLTHLMGKGDKVDAKTPLALVHGNDAHAVERAARLVQEAYRIGARAVRGPSIIERIAAK